MENFSITKIIRDYIINKGISQRKLSELLQESPSNFNQKLSKHDMDLSYVRSICIALNHDFFAEASRSLPISIQGQKISEQHSEIEKALMKFIESNYPKLKK